jgi:hypothetical protein
LGSQERDLQDHAENITVQKGSVSANEEMFILSIIYKPVKPPTSKMQQLELGNSNFKYVTADIGISFLKFILMQRTLSIERISPTNKYSPKSF